MAVSLLLIATRLRSGFEERKAVISENFYVAQPQAAVSYEVGWADSLQEAQAHVRFSRILFP